MGVFGRQAVLRVVDRGSDHQAPVVEVDDTMGMGSRPRAYGRRPRIRPPSSSRQTSRRPRSRCPRPPGDVNTARPSCSTAPNTSTSACLRTTSSATKAATVTPARYRHSSTFHLELIQLRRAVLDRFNLMVLRCRQILRRGAVCHADVSGRAGPDVPRAGVRDSAFHHLGTAGISSSTRGTERRGSCKGSTTPGATSVSASAYRSTSRRSFS